jgi:hypothetical protein
MPRAVGATGKFFFFSLQHHRHPIPRQNFFSNKDHSNDDAEKEEVKAAPECLVRRQYQNSSVGSENCCVQGCQVGEITLILGSFNFVA